MLTLTRRGLVAALASLALVSPALAQDWRAQFPELTIGISSGENETDAIARNQPYADYLSRELGVPVKMIRGTDYAAVIEAHGRRPMPWPARSWARTSPRWP
jgi:phosphonate transport system substrate-binding protein